MDIEYTGRQTTITKKQRLQCEVGLAQIVKITGSAGSVHVILCRDKYRHIAEITVQLRLHKLVANCEATDMETALHDALGKIEQQAIRHKKKFATVRRHPKEDVKAVRSGVVTTSEAASGVKAFKKAAVVKAPAKSGGARRAVPMLVHSFPSHSPIEEPHLVRPRDVVALRPMSVEEAVKEAAFRDRDVFVFRNHAGQAMVLHRRRDGKMELIEVP